MRILDKIEYVWKDEWFYKRLIRNTVIYPYIYIYVNKFHHIEIFYVYVHMYICMVLYTAWCWRTCEGHLLVFDPVQLSSWSTPEKNWVPLREDAVKKSRRDFCKGISLDQTHTNSNSKENLGTQRYWYKYEYIFIYGFIWCQLVARSNSHMTSICCHKLHYYAFCSQQMRTNTQRFMFGKNETHVIRVVLL